MEEFFEISILYDFYGEFLTEKQKKAVEYYYSFNYSLAEIGEKMGITRQAVRDLLIRSKEILHDFDIKLNLVQRYKKRQTTVLECMDILNEIDQNGSDQEIKGMVDSVKAKLGELLEEN
ncbi:sigma factor-like helix-turn-helix DNA-binding protein [Alkalibacter mobilis]|uniref:sigma factor-like helix-turn-helix DNA-binding protein n=1 Tax=Alkalibacter mobilis TaxID=2787712 RepID=UPI00189C8F31|nr:sigma factor-like helix-turn-helix DNA-binding protein [Alkalibacter mobilis]MBF7095833.1 hypothetical protein [Alkalibacter mobilis]